ncbi:MAG: right-handed parallel beta-helix repeat-containing protein [Candidatus Schekmanbacteria bacterium]|nr:right-handed parallel beta-helix repeat-containing protein [Candidatus Schekmanbacteria bacterium]
MAHGQVFKSGAPFVRFRARLVAGASLTLALASLLCAPAFATDYHVSSGGGSDANDGLSPSDEGKNHGPWKTLSKASEKIYQPGDRLLLDRGSTWSDKDFTKDGGECELVLKGTADIRKNEWITVEPYTRVSGDENMRPHITFPSKDTTPGLLDWADVVSWAKKHQGTGFDQYLDRDYVRIAIRIDGNGWKIRGLEISRAEMGIASYLEFGDGFWFEDLYMHDMIGLAWPKHPDFTEKQTLFSTTPLIFGAIHMKAYNVTVKDCSIIKNYDPLFIGGDGISGEFHNALFENLYISHMAGAGGMSYVSGTNITVRNCTILHGEHGMCTLDPNTFEHVLTPQFQGCWYGPDAFDITYSTNYVIDSSEVAYVKSGPGGADQSPISIQGENVNVTVENSFLHGSEHPAFGFHYGIGIFKQKGTRIENNVIYRNGVENPDVMPALSGDAMWPLDYDPASTSDFTYAGNRVYRDEASGQELLAYVDGDPAHYWNDFSELSCPYEPPQGNYSWSGLGNRVITTGYDNYVPTPPRISSVNLATRARVTQSSRHGRNYDARNARDGSFATYWRPSEADWTDGDVWIRYTWRSPRDVDRIRIFDRREVGHASRSGYLLFSNGARVNVTGGILDNGAMREVILDAPQRVTWVELHVTRREGGAGISELRVHANSVQHTVPEEPSAGSFTDDFETSPLDVLVGTAGGPSEPKNNIDWGKADFSVAEESPGGNRFAFINFTPLVVLDPPTAFPVTWASRTIKLPKGKMLKSIDVYAPPSAEFGQFGIYIGQLGADAPIEVSESDGGWHTYTMGWSNGSPQSDVVMVGVWLPGHASGYGVDTVAFDNLIYE